MHLIKLSQEFFFSEPNNEGVVVVDSDQLNVKLASLNHLSSTVRLKGAANM